MPSAFALPFVVQTRKRKRPVSYKMYALLILVVTCLCLCAVQYTLLPGTDAAHIESPHHMELALRMGEITGERRNELEVWNAPQDTVVRFSNLSTEKQPSFTDYMTLDKLSLTAVLPVTTASLPNLERQLHTLIHRSDYLTEIVLVPQEALQAQCRRIILSVLAAADSLAYIELSVAPWLSGVDKDSAMLHASRQATTSFLLLLDECGLESVDERSRDALTLLSPFSSGVPIGPRGLIFVGTEPTCLPASAIPQPVDYLLPPFVLPTHLLSRFQSGVIRGDASQIWHTLGRFISHAQHNTVGGFVVGSDISGWCLHEGASTKVANGQQLMQAQFTADVEVNDAGADQAHPNDVCPSGFGSLAVLLSSQGQLDAFSSAACSWQRDGHTLHIVILGKSPDASGQSVTMQSENCTLNYRGWPMEDEVQIAGKLVGWLDNMEYPADVIITSFSKDTFPGGALSLSRGVTRSPTVIRIPSRDIPYCDWIGTLSLDELRRWHEPQVAISVITNDRPQSLSRLLDSLSHARYFGDALDLRINIEQTADLETQHIVGGYTWEHGRVFLHRRIIHGGLLPAVVESWYPQSNDSYGLILEDDVELSPLFYAWIKLSLLRYRYGRPEDTSSQLFGISLYQQKHLELRPEGRHPFNARNILASTGLSDPSTPYLSQIPCSWGAVYFPEHWREFHAYLSFRLAEYAWDGDQVVVPGVRSNKWTRSWKKYFIELAYLRGYVMLYPNYADYVSFSTNHLEVGSHVKDVPVETYLRKKRLFLLPLMPLPQPAQASSTGLLKLPRGQLPVWTELPTLDLLGLIATEKTLQERGHVRRTELTGCEDRPTVQFDVWDLLCLYDSRFGLQ